MSTRRLATFLALAAAVISGTNNFLAKIAVTVIKDPIFYTTLKNSVVAVLLIGAVLMAKKLPEIRRLRRQQLLKLTAVGVIGGALPFALFFSGLQQTTAVNAGLIHKTLFLWVMLIAIPTLKERMRWQQLAGVAILFSANLLIGGFTGFKYTAGEFMILAATVFWAVENVIAKLALKDISSVTVAAFRMTLGSLLLLVFLILRGTSFAALGDLNLTQWWWTLATSALLFGFVTTWYTALKHAPATYVATLLVPATLVTNVLSAIFVTGSFAAPQIVSSALFVAGTAMMVFFAKKTADSLPSRQSAGSTA